MEITGKIIAVLEAREGVAKSTGNPWKIQEYVLETINEQFPRRMCFNVFGADKINQFNIQMGQELTVSFDINAREYQGRWYNDIRAWKVESAQSMQPAAPIIPEPAPFPPVQEAAPSFGNENSGGDDGSELPF